MTFVAKSLEDIARMFEQIATRTEEQKSRGLDTKLNRREAHAWRSAANLLRDTIIENPRFNPSVLEPCKNRLNVIREFEEYEDEDERHF